MPDAVILHPSDQQTLSDLITALYDAVGPHGCPPGFDLTGWLADLARPVTPELLFANRMLLTAWLHGLDFPADSQRETLARLTALQRQLTAN